MPQPTDIFTPRQQRLFEALGRQDQSFDAIVVLDMIHQYYFCGTMQDAVLIFTSDLKGYLFVRKSCARAKIEAVGVTVLPMRSYRDVLGVLPEYLKTIFVEKRWASMLWVERFSKYIKFDRALDLDPVMFDLRAVKDETEKGLLREAGRRQHIVLESVLLDLIDEGISEAELSVRLYAEMVRKGHHGLARFSMPQMEMAVGQIAFGDHAIYPTSFDGPGGMRGLSAVVPLLGDRNRLLKKGDLVFVDAGFGFEGYHSDKTVVYSFGHKPSVQAVDIHEACREVLHRIVDCLKPGAILHDIYQDIMSGLPSCLNQHFMGYGNESVRFLGHGIGLYIDEAPVIALGYRRPLEEGMFIAIEPKCGIEGVGMVGVEESYEITADGAVCITGGDKPLRAI